jgi:hypothetical protein
MKHDDRLSRVLQRYKTGCIPFNSKIKQVSEKSDYTDMNKSTRINSLVSTTVADGFSAFGEL